MRDSLESGHKSGSRIPDAAESSHAGKARHVHDALIKLTGSEAICGDLHRKMNSSHRTQLTILAHCSRSIRAMENKQRLGGLTCRLGEARINAAVILRIISGPVAREFRRPDVRRYAH